MTANSKPFLPRCPRCKRRVGYYDACDLGRNGPRECPHCCAALVWSVRFGTIRGDRLHRAKPNAQWRFA